MDTEEKLIVVPLPEGEVILNGFDLGRSTRKTLRLDSEDRLDAPVALRFETPVVTSTFIRGLLGPTVKALGYERFTKKYHFVGSADVRENILATAHVVGTDKTGM